MVLRNGDSDRAGEQQNRGFVASLFRRKGSDRRPPANSHPGYGHPFLSSRQHDASGPGGRWACNTGRKQGRDYDGGYGQSTSAYSAPALLREVSLLQEQVAQQAEQLEELHRELEERDAEGDELKQALNLERFKYELLVDLWSMRVLDNEELGHRMEANAQGMGGGGHRG